MGIRRAGLLAGHYGYTNAIGGDTQGYFVILGEMRVAADDISNVGVTRGELNLEWEAGQEFDLTGLPAGQVCLGWQVNQRMMVGCHNGLR